MLNFRPLAVVLLLLLVIPAFAKDEKFSKVNTMISKAEDGSMQIRLEPLPEMPDYLKQLIEENK